MLLRFSFLFILILISGCSSQSRKTPSSVAEVIRSEVEDTDFSRNPTVQPRQFVNVVDQEVRGRKLHNNKFDFPVVVNSAVIHWIDYFTGRGRPYFEKYLQRSRYFIPPIAKLLKQNDMPQDLVYLAMIESGFNNVAKSFASAVGPWQFIRQTGRRYGLRVDYWVDERRNTEKSTMAAIGYLKELYGEFHSWEVSAASYNAGENKLRKAIRRFHSTDFWTLARHHFLKSETRHYVPKIMAAAILAKNPEQFGFQDPFAQDTLNPTLLNDDSELAPKMLGEPLPEADQAGSVEGALAAADHQKETGDSASGDLAENAASEDDSDELGDSDEFASVVSDHESLSSTSSIYMVSNPGEKILEFEVKGPADLFAISRAGQVPFSTVKALNPELLRWCTPPDLNSYRIRLPASARDNFLSFYNSDQFERRVVFSEYRVRRGDSVGRVASRFRTAPEVVRELNGLGSSAQSLMVGRLIKLPLPTGYKRVLASLFEEKVSFKKGKRRHHRRRGRRSRRFAMVSASGSSHGKVRARRLASVRKHEPLE